MHNPGIRPATCDDAPQLAALLAQVFAATYGAVIPPGILAAYLEQAFAPQQVAAELCNPSMTHLVAAGATGIVGVCKLVPGSPQRYQFSNAIEVARLYVDLDLHGQGTAAALLQYALSDARSHGYTTAWLCVWQQNARAMAFYRKHGFTEFGQMPVFVDSIQFDDLLLQRKLDDY